MSPQRAVHGEVSDCVVIDTFELLDSKWRLVVLHALQQGEQRFNELQRTTRASSQTLSRALDDLTDEGLVDRRVEAESPIAVYYQLTPTGKRLQPVFEAVEQWAADQ